jgi:GTP-binding protein
MDAGEGVAEQDMRLIGHVLEAGRSLVIAVNKWDGMQSDQKVAVRALLDRKLDFVDFAEVHYISALHGSGVGKLFSSVQTAYRSATRDLPTPGLTRILHDAVQAHPPPLVHGRRIKLRYAHQGGSNPPVIVIHGNQVERLPESYRRYLVNTFRRVLDLRGTPVRIELKGGVNPFKGRKRPLTRRQAEKRRRSVRRVKKWK